MKQQWLELQEKFNALSLSRRKFWFVLTLIFVAYLGLYVLLLPVWQSYQSDATQLQQQENQLNVLEQQIQAVEIRLSGDPKAPLKRRLENFEQQLEAINQRLQNETNYVSAADNRRLLQALLVSASQLTVVSAQAKPAERIYGDNESQQGAIYKHRLQLVVQGSYQQIYEYFRRLEQLPWSFYWQKMDYGVVNYPQAEVTLEIYTLSLERDYVAS